MCHKDEIEKCIESGMPRKLIKTIQFALRKRTGHQQNGKEQQQNKPQEPQIFVSKCPFGYGKFATPAAQALPTNNTTQTTTPLIKNEFDFSNNNNTNGNLYEPFPQISQLGTILTGTETTTTTADNNGNAITNLSGHFDDDNKKLLTTKKNVYNDDILAKSTQISKEYLNTIQQAIRWLQTTKTYTLLTKTTQPAHIVAMGIVTFVLLTVWPQLIDNATNEENLAHQQEHISTTVPQQKMSAKRNNIFPLIAYLAAFSIHFGAQIWMTFVSGLSLYFGLPRHIFGQCQQILFPKYFAINAALSITMFTIYVKYFISTWTLAKCVQFGTLALTATIELLVRLYLAPPMLRLMHEKYKIEEIVGTGKEVGNLVQGDLIHCPHYQRIHKAFRRLHTTIAMGNIITMVGSCLQLYNIASQLQISTVQ